LHLFKRSVNMFRQINSTEEEKLVPFERRYDKQDRETCEAHMILNLAEINSYIYQPYKLVYRGRYRGRDMVEVVDLTKAVTKAKSDPQHALTKAEKPVNAEDLS